MAIRMMISKAEFEKNPTNVEIVTNYPGHSTNEVAHSYNCIHTGKWESKGTITSECVGCNFFEPLYMRTTHVGMVIELRERNGYNDSDFYAVVWNAEKGITEHVEYGTTRGWTYPNNAQVDATAEVLLAVKAFQEKQSEMNRQRYLAEKAKMPEIGKRVKVIGGRKLPKGTECEVFWFGKDTYKTNSKYSSGIEGLVGFTYYPEDYRVGVRLISGEKCFVSAKNIEVINE